MQSWTQLMLVQDPGCSRPFKMGEFHFRYHPKIYAVETRQTFWIGNRTCALFLFKTIESFAELNIPFVPMKSINFLSSMFFLGSVSRHL